jgi:Na+/H+-dicarboxylate symporter
MCRTAENTKAMVQLFAGLGGYALTVLLGLIFLAGPVYYVILKFFSRHKNIRVFYQTISPAQLLGFSTCSTAATLPVTFECLDELNIPRQVSSFVLPIGATINMDGTSLYQAVAVIFLAQMHMVDLSLGQQLTIVLTATLASIGAASVPGSGLIMLLMVLQSVGLNPAWVAIILPVDRLLDMCRTVLNVTGDCVVASVVHGKRDSTQIIPDTIQSAT